MFENFSYICKVNFNYMNYRQSTYLSYAMTTNMAGFPVAGICMGGVIFRFRNYHITGMTVLHWVAMLFVYVRTN